jgi:hypothetical protein
MSTYLICVQGHLEARWAEWFDGLTLTNHPDGTAELRGPVGDQAALHGLLSRIRDLGIPLLAVCRVANDEATDTGREEP